MRCVRGCGGAAIWRAIAAIGLAIVSATATLPAHADDGLASGEASQPHFEIWSGGQAYAHVWSLYSGATVAPFGGIQDDGWRLRLVAGHGADQYSGPRSVGAGPPVVYEFKGTGSFADLLLGYHRQIGVVTLKVYSGRARLGWRLTPALSLGLEAGAAGNLEGDVAHAGGFIRYEWTAGEMSASAGATSDGLLYGIGPSLARSATPFVTVNWLSRF
jgi:hypothetical protein